MSLTFLHTNLSGHLYQFLISVIVLFVLSIPAMAQQQDTPIGSTSGAPVPRFSSLNDDEANMRTGPGFRYPVAWTYRRKSLPVEIIAEFESWRKIRDWRGIEGWVHRAMLSPRRMGIVNNKQANLHASARPDAKVLASMEEGVIVHLEKCSKDWCKVKVESFRGWVQRQGLWGLYPAEIID